MVVTITTMLLITLLFVIFLLRGIMIVQQSETVVIERLGRYHKTLDSGINVIIPFIDRPRSMMKRVLVNTSSGSIYRTVQDSRIDLRETMYDFPSQSVITRDNVVTQINAVLYFQIISPARAIYEISNLPAAIEMLTQTSLRNVIGEMDLDETLTSRDTINGKLRDILDDATNKWGVKTNRVELQDINPPKDIRDAMEKQMRAERDKRAQILTAEGQKESIIKESEARRLESINHAEGKKRAKILSAEADKESKILRAEGEAQFIERISKSLKEISADPTQYLIAMRYFDVLTNMNTNKNDKVIYLPYEATNILSALGGIKELCLPKK